MEMRYYPHPPPLAGEPLSEEVILSSKELIQEGEERWCESTPHHLSCCGVRLCMFANVLMGQY